MQVMGSLAFILYLRVGPQPISKAKLEMENNHEILSSSQYLYIKRAWTEVHVRIILQVCVLSTYRRSRHPYVFLLSTYY